MNELMKLRNELIIRDIDFTEASRHSFNRLFFSNKNGEKCSVVFSDCSFGNKFGLLEVTPCIHTEVKEYGASVEGWLTAAEIIQAWF